MNNETLIIIGAGASGLVASIVASRRGKSVTILEQQTKVGRKILASGNGKCNITNRTISPTRYHSHNPTFISEVLKEYPYAIVEKFFTSIGLPLVETQEGKVFPLSMQASSVVELLLYEAQSLGVEIICDTKVTDICQTSRHFQLETTQGDYRASKILLATGSVAAPQLGGSNDGYALATKLGHSLIKRHPSLVQLCSQEPWVKQCAGVKITGVATLYANGVYITQKQGDLLFTPYGISGLAILDLSREVSSRLAQYDYCELSLDLMPTYTKEQLTTLLLSQIHPTSHKPLTLWLQGFLNKKLIHTILSHAKTKVTTEGELNRKAINQLVHTIKNLKLSLSDTKGFRGAEVATGGIDTTEVTPQTMESKLIPNLFFSGEILDVDGDRGGFNFHFAWVCGLRVGGVA